MSEIIEKTYKLLDTLDNSEVIKTLTQSKEKILQDDKVLSLIKQIQQEENPETKIKLRKELYKNNDYKKYMESYNELSLIIFKINHKYKEFTNTKEGSCNG